MCFHTAPNIYPRKSAFAPGGSERQYSTLLLEVKVMNESLAAFSCTKIFGFRLFYHASDT